MFGLSYGEIFLLIGATAALIGPKDLPKIARTAGRLAGRAIGYVQMARGQFDNVLQQSQASQVHKELQDAMAQLDAIRYEIRSISLMNPGPMTRKFMDAPVPPTTDNGSKVTSTIAKPQTEEMSKESVSTEISPSNLQTNAVTYARLAKSATKGSTHSDATMEINRFNNDAGLLNILPVSAESAGMLPKRAGVIKGSDIMLEAIMEADVADKAMHFFAQPENQVPRE